jgi:hypothetical protein
MQATAYGDPGGTEEGDTRTRGWENHIYLDGNLLHTYVPDDRPASRLVIERWKLEAKSERTEFNV